MAFEENLKKCGCAIKRDCRLKSSFGDEFTVKTAVFPSDFTAAAKAAKACGGAVYLGGITNTLVLGDIDIAVCMRGMKGIIDGERDLYVMAGESLASVCRWARMRGLSGMEQLCGIPGTVGRVAEETVEYPLRRDTSAFPMGLAQGLVQETQVRPGVGGRGQVGFVYAAAPDAEKGGMGGMAAVGEGHVLPGLGVRGDEAQHRCREKSFPKGRWAIGFPPVFRPHAIRLQTVSSVRSPRPSCGRDRA